jgi:hypothetical protein
VRFGSRPEHDFRKLKGVRRFWANGIQVCYYFDDIFSLGGELVRYHLGHIEFLEILFVQEKVSMLF